jgi:hypothetical protein
MAIIPPGGEVNQAADLLAKEELITALVKFADAGEMLAERCHAERLQYLWAYLSGSMERLHEEVAHESAKRSLL